MTASIAESSATAFERITGPQVWHGPDMAARRGEWSYELTAEDRADLEQATAAAMATGKDILALESADFPLAGFGRTLSEMRQVMLHGRGFQLIRGLPIQGKAIDEIATLYWGIGSHLGVAG